MSKMPEVTNFWYVASGCVRSKQSPRRRDHRAAQSQNQIASSSVWVRAIAKLLGIGQRAFIGFSLTVPQYVAGIACDE
jgi:hypothetical protein